MEVAFLVLTLGCTLAVALGHSRMVLGFMLHAMVGDLSPLVRARRLLGKRRRLWQGRGERMTHVVCEDRGYGEQNRASER